jgi:3-oxoacyl-[acyl-carrier-protein] synthase-3
VIGSANGMHVSITGLGCHVPAKVVTNDDLSLTLDTSDEWIRTRTGIRERRVAAQEEALSDIAMPACLAALEQAGVAAADLDLIIVATVTPDMTFPSTGAILADRLGARDAAAYDLSAGCTGFMYALAQGYGMLAGGLSQRALIVGGDLLSKLLDWSDRSTCVLFGDGAGAVVLRPTEAGGVLGSVLGSDGRAAEILYIPAGGSVRPATHETVEARDHSIRMPKGREVFKRAVVEMAGACRQLLEKSGYTSDDVDLLIPHQANSRIMIAVAERMGIRLDRAVVDVETVGNTSAASVPIALHRAWRGGRVHEGDLVLLTSFGAGLAWGANLIRWTGPPPP